MKNPWPILVAGLLLGCSDPTPAPGPGAGASAAPAPEPEPIVERQPPAGSSPLADETPDRDPESESESTPLPLPDDRPAAILFDGTDHDFGDVLDIGELAFSFSFMNVGDRPLVIGELDPSCGCTTLELDRKEYGPGEVGTIDVVWDTIGWGQQRKSIRVHSNAEGRPVTLLSVAATIEPFARTLPPVLDFGPSDGREESRIRFELLCQDPNFQIEEVRSPLAEIGLFVLEPPQDGRAVLEAVRAPTTRVGSFLPALEVVVVGRPRGGTEDVRHPAEVKTRANLYREVLVDPPLVSIGRLQPGGHVEQRVRVTRPKGGTFTVTGASVSGASLEELRVETKPTESGEAFELVLSGPVGTLEGPLRGALVIETDLPDEPTRSVPLMGMIAR